MLELILLLLLRGRMQWGFGVYYSVLIVNSTFCYCSGQITTDLVKNNSCGQKTSMSFIKVRSRWWKAIRKGSPRHSIARRQASWASRPTALLTFKNRGSRENMPSEHFSVVYLFINRFRSLFVDWTLYIQILITQTCAELHFSTKMHQLTSQKTDPDAHLHCLCFFSWTYTKRILAC